MKKAREKLRFPKSQKQNKQRFPSAKKAGSPRRSRFLRGLVATAAEEDEQRDWITYAVGTGVLDCPFWEVLGRDAPWLECGGSGVTLCVTPVSPAGSVTPRV